MESEAGHDPLAEDEGGDPFATVPADGGGEPDPELVAPGELGGENPSEETEQEELAPDPLAEPAPGEFMEEPEEETTEPEPEPEPAPEAAASPAAEDEPIEPPSEEELAADAEAEAAAAEEAKAEEPEPTPEPESPPPSAPEPDQTKKKSQPKSGGKKPKAAASDAPKGSREYVVLKCDKDENPTGIAGEGTWRSDKDARRAVFSQMDDSEAKLVAIPARYWKVKTLKAQEETVRNVSEE